MSNFRPLRQTKEVEGTTGFRLNMLSILFLLLLIIGIIFIIIPYGLVSASEPEAIVEGDGFRVEISQDVVLIRIDDPSDANDVPRASADTEYVYIHELDDSTNITTDGEYTFDGYSKFEYPYSLKVLIDSSEDYEDPINISTTGSHFDYDETGDVGIYYNLKPYRHYINQGLEPYVNIVLNITNGTDYGVLGFHLMGDSEESYSGNDVVEYWVDYSSTTSIYHWGLFLMDDIRSQLNHLKPTHDFDNQDIEIQNISIYCGDDVSNTRLHQFNFDYLFQTTRPSDMSGGVWYNDTNNQIVTHYQILTDYNITTIDSAFNITSTINTELYLKILNYVNITRLYPLPYHLQIQDYMVYHDLLAIHNISGQTITSTTYNNTAAHQIIGQRASAPISLIDNSFIGRRLNYTFSVNMTVWGLQYNNEWAWDSLDKLKRVDDFIVYIGGSIFITSESYTW